MPLTKEQLEDIEKLKKRKYLKITIYKDGYSITPSKNKIVEVVEVDKRIDEVNEFIALIKKNEEEFDKLPPEKQKEILEARKNFESRERAFMESQDYIVQNKL